MVTRRVRGNVKRSAPRAAVRAPRSGLDAATDVQTSYFFMLNCLLHSRVHTGIESNSEFYDEDVNVYLAHLLNSRIDAGYLTTSASRIAPHDAALARMIAESSGDRERYEIYRANADYLLMAVAVFDLFEDRHLNRLSAFHVPKQAYIGRAASYYALASSYATKIGRGLTAIAETLSKISEGIDSYVRILSYMRGQYLDFIKRYSVGELFHLERSIEEIRLREKIEHERNEFLDIYHAWLKTRDASLRGRLAEQAERLRELDPSFRFTLPA
jgi:hypothetical protein